MLAMLDSGGPERDQIVKLKESLNLSKTLGAPVQEIQLQQHISSIQMACGQLDEALSCGQEALNQSQTIGNRLEEAKSLSLLAQVLDQKGEHQLAAEQVGIAEAMLQSMGIPIQPRGQVPFPN